MLPIRFASLALACCAALQLAAQTSQALHRHDALLARLLQQEKRDSFLLFSDQKAQLARRTDSLALWAATQLHSHEIFGSDYPQILQCLNAALDGRWREPANAAEWRPFLLIQATKGWALSKMGRIWEAVQAYEQAAQIYERFDYPDVKPSATIYKALGNHFTRLGENEKALAIFQKALAKDDQNESRAGLLSNIGIAHWNRGDYRAATDYFRQGLALPDVSDNKRALLFSGLAQNQLDDGQAETAFRTAAAALGLLRPKSPDDRSTFEYRARARRTAGESATATRRWREAEQLLAGALADAHIAFGKHSRDVGKIEIARSRLALLQGQAAAALDAANRALFAVLPDFQIVKPESNPLASSFYEENTLFEALAAKALAAEIQFEKSRDPHWLHLALQCHDLAWQAETRLRQVYQYSSSKLGLQAAARDREAAAMRVARALFEQTGDAQWLQRAFAIAERSKAALLLEALHDNLMRQRLSGSDPRFVQINALRRNLSSFEKNILLDPTNAEAAQWRIEADALGSQVVALERALREAYPALSAFERASSVAAPADAELADGETLLEYFVGESFVEIFVFRRGQPAAWRRVPNGATLQALTGQFLAYFQNANAILSDPEGYFRAAHALWQALLPPEAANAQRLSIVPDGFLNFVPFEALVTAAPNGNFSLRNAPYLLRQASVRYAWSLAVLRQQNQLQSRAGGYLLALAPGFAKGQRGLAPLASNGLEWPRAAQKLEAEKADVQHFMAKNADFRILHFSTHAFADANPRIELFDQALFLPDLYALSLQADLVVLSACQTGLGAAQKGEGVMSLARAFAQSGAACTVSSLWSVNDRSTARLLTRFYQKIELGARVGEALRAAKLAYLDDPALGAAAQSPYFWAGLVSVGADRPVAQPIGQWWMLAVGFALILGIGWVARGRFATLFGRPK
jgi:CHAT domain-containing protein/tetratricopeptide (TPR) repeat protein